MRALTAPGYVTADGLVLADVDTPSLEPDRVLIRVEAASLNAWDWHMYRGEPSLMRKQMGRTGTSVDIVGADVAGVVTEVGADVTALKAGDRVFGTIGFGACAEFAAPRARDLEVIPHGVSFDQAAAVAMAGRTALRGLRDVAGVKPGARVLVWGASGGVGHMAVQIARLLGAASVDAVCSARNADMVRSLGADRVFAYDKGEQPEGPYDVIYDTVATASVGTYKRIATPKAPVILAGAFGGGKLLGPLAAIGPTILGGKLRGVNAQFMPAVAHREDLAPLAAWLASGELRCVIQETYPLERAAEACRVLEGAHVAGKLVVVP